MGRAPLVLMLVALTGCNQYDLFRLSGYQQESFSNKADILFVIDNSDSMTDEASALASNFADFISTIQTQEEELVREDLGDAVDNYQSYVQDRGSFVDFQIAVTTTDIPRDWGDLAGPAPQKILKRGDDALAERFKENLLCHSTCFRGDPQAGDINAAYLDNLCGEGNWQDVNCADSGREEGLEAVFMAMCRGVPNPPAECFEALPVVVEDPGADTGFTDAFFTDMDVLSAEGFFRQGSTFIPVIVSDEGDASRRENDGDEFPDNYKDLFEIFGIKTSWVGITPPLDDSFEAPVGCTGIQEWSVFRYDFMVRVSNGLKIPIALPKGGACDPSAEDCCPSTDFGESLNQFGAILQNLLTVFKLQSVPDPDSIIVFVDGKEISESQVVNTDAYGLPVYGSGWSYEPDINSIQFHGESIPPNDARVQVYFDPIDGMPRELPF